MKCLPDSMSKPVVDIIIVNWNSGDQLQRCLTKTDPVTSESLEIDRIVVVDNASTDSSITGLAAKNHRLLICRNSDNVGFAAACNQGARDSRADYLVFMNPDVYLHENSLSVLIAFLHDPKNSGVGICAPRLVDRAGNTQRTCARFPGLRDFLITAFGLNRVLPKVFRSSLMVEWTHEDSRAVDQVMGACFLIRNSMFQLLKGFDERFFVYFEEVDLCLRCRQLGSGVYFLSESTAEHVGGGCSGQIPATRLFYSLRSRLQYACKNFSPISASILCLVTLFIEPVSRTALSLIHGSTKELWSTWEAYRLLYSSLASVLTVRVSELRFSLSRN
jgi:N-acetylglucosaminyl-diphospho-decaprenol L-rhamnosyltransferase